MLDHQGLRLLVMVWRSPHRISAGRKQPRANRGSHRISMQLRRYLFATAPILLRNSMGLEECAGRRRNALSLQRCSAASIRLLSSWQKGGGGVASSHIFYLHAGLADNTVRNSCRWFTASAVAVVSSLRTDQRTVVVAKGGRRFHPICYCFVTDSPICTNTPLPSQQGLSSSGRNWDVYPLRSGSLSAATNTESETSLRTKAGILLEQNVLWTLRRHWNYYHVPEAKLSTRPTYNGGAPHWLLYKNCLSHQSRYYISLLKFLTKGFRLCVSEISVHHFSFHKTSVGAHLNLYSQNIIICGCYHSTFALLVTGLLFGGTTRCCLVVCHSDPLKRTACIVSYSFKRVIILFFSCAMVSNDLTNSTNWMVFGRPSYFD